MNVLPNKPTIINDIIKEMQNPLLLYHGTDIRMVRMPEEERANYHKGCRHVLDYLIPFFNIGQSEIQKRLGDEHCTKYKLFWQAWIRFGGYRSKNPKYQYGNFNVTNMKGRAIIFAYNSFAGGELGMVAYEMFMAARRMGFENWSPSHEVLKAFEKIDSFVKQKHEPALFVFPNLDIQYMKHENGSELFDFEPEGMANGSIGLSLCYDKKLDLDISKAELLPLSQEREGLVKESIMMGAI